MKIRNYDKYYNSVCENVRLTHHNPIICALGASTASSQLDLLRFTEQREPHQINKLCLMTIASWYHPFPSRTGP